MFRTITVQEGSKAANGIGDVRPSPNRNVHERSYKSGVGGAVDPGSKVGGKRDSFVRGMEAKATNHGGVNGMCRVDVETFDDAVNKGSLGNGYGVGWKVSCDAYPKGELGLTEVRDLPLRGELSFKTSVLSRGGGGGDNVVDMDGKDDGASG